MSMNWFDLAVLVFLTWGAVGGYFKGFYTAAFNFLGWTVALITAFLFKGSFSYFVNQQYNITPKITTAISENVNLPVKVIGGHFSGEDPFTFIQGISLPHNIKNNILEYFNREGERLLEQGGTVADFLYSWLADVIVNILCFFSIFIVVGAIFKLGEGVIQGKINIREKGGQWLNSGTGLLTGVLKNALIVIAIIYLVSPLLELFDFVLIADIKKSFIVSTLYALFFTLFN